MLGAVDLLNERYGLSPHLSVAVESVCDTPAITSSYASGMVLERSSPIATGTILSLAPWSTSVGAPAFLAYSDTSTSTYPLIFINSAA